jgi:hypothetical protein
MKSGKIKRPILPNSSLELGTQQIGKQTVLKTAAMREQGRLLAAEKRRLPQASWTSEFPSSRKARIGEHR